ncbi:MAG TPA: hypothetical protein EYG79_10645 [Rhodobacteraceae bacterium]|nr:hypothetical protein [Paracoccaceae bacterium]
MRLILALMLAFPAALQAGQTCPVGGGEVLAPPLEPCEETYMRRMSYAPANGCTAPRIAQCRGNFLPLYKDFSDSELALVRQYMQMESFESAVDSSPYFLAYNTERFLGGDQDLPFQLLLEGLWYDAPRSFPDPVYMDDFFFEAAGAINRAAPDELASLHAIIAFAYTQVDDRISARAHLEKSVDLGVATVFLTGYQLAVEECIEDPASRFCDPETLSPGKG